MKKILAIILLVLSLGLFVSFAANIGNLSNYFNNSNNSNSNTNINNDFNNSVVANNDNTNNNDNNGSNEEQEEVIYYKHQVHLEDSKSEYAHPTQLAPDHNVLFGVAGVEFDFTFYSTSDTEINSYDVLLEYFSTFSESNNNSNISFVGDGTFTCDLSQYHFNNALFNETEGEFNINYIIYNSSTNKIYCPYSNDNGYVIEHKNNTIDYSNSVLNSGSIFDKYYIVYSFSISDNVTLAS